MALSVYRGDDFYFDIGANYEDDSILEFNTGDIIRVGVKDKLTNSRYVLFKEIPIEQKTDTESVHFTGQETKKCSEGEKILEVELTQTDGSVSTLYQDKLTLKGDVIR